VINSSVLPSHDFVASCLFICLILWPFSLVFSSNNEEKRMSFTDGNASISSFGRGVRADQPGNGKWSAGAPRHGNVKWLCLSLCAKTATRLHSRYSRVVKELPCAGQQVQLILHVRKFFCDTTDCARKIFAERLPQLVAPWAQMSTRLCQAIQAIGLATCGRLGARLASRLGITTSWMTIVRRVMALPTKPAENVYCLGIDDFSDLARENVRHRPGEPGHPPGH
jgi:hypothetical protein